MTLPTYNEIKPYVEKGLISEQRHPDAPDVAIFNYTHECQFSAAWDDVTTQCRGLIMNVVTGEVLARPFPKFFNLSEHDVKDTLPNLPLQETPEIYEKYDGSLGIMYWLSDKPFIATRGSFTSEQAQWATEWIKDRIPRRSHKFLIPPEITCLYEIIYSENRIVVKYDFEGLIYLDAIDIKTGKSRRNEGWTFGKDAELIHNTDWRSLHKLADDNKEGFVLFFPESNFRIKVKFDEYVRLHKIMTGMSEKGVWEWLREHGAGADITEMAKDAPDEFYDWLKRIAKEILIRYWTLHEGASFDFHKIKDLPTRKEFAEQAIKSKYTPLLFALLDGKDIEPLIWKQIRPRATGVYKKDIDA